VGQGFLVLGIWFGVFWLINRWLWRKGLKQFSGMGA
jgi:ABC-2 type transport system permease protein